MNLLWLWILLGVVVLVIVFIIGLYNSLVHLNMRVKEAWSDITVQLKRRADLFGNLVETVKGSAKFEKGTIEHVTEARAGLTEAIKKGAAPAEVAKAENVLTKTIGGLNFEAYPQLQTVANYGKLMDEVSDTEDKIQAARRFYNGGVRDFNVKIKVFPNNLFASILGFKEYELFEVEDRADLEKGQDASKSNVSFDEK
ncbi:LemA family protein [Candidatus Saccharibacteria bacterium]|nr:LemA family protein [Candidatus Saccharibacteria bacterium]